MSQFTPTEKTKVRRKPDRGSYDRELIYRILDEAFVCHLGFVVDGQPYVVPTNYVLMGKAEPIEGEAAKLAAMRDFVEYVNRGRWATVRPPSEQELKGTMVLVVPLVEASAKVRTGFAVDNGEDYASPAWTGVLPMKWTAQAPVPDPRGNPEIPVPANILHYSRPQ